jgi:anti-anti-sigma factor
MNAHLVAPQELNIYQAADWWRQLQETLRAQPSPALDCSQMLEIDGAGLQLLLLAAQEVTKAGGEFSLVGLTEPINRKLAEFGVLSRFNVVPGAPQ